MPKPYIVRDVAPSEVQGGPNGKAKAIVEVEWVRRHKCCAVVSPENICRWGERAISPDMGIAPNSLGIETTIRVHADMDIVMQAKMLSQGKAGQFVSPQESYGNPANLVPDHRAWPGAR